MKITQIITARFRKEYRSIFIDGELALKVHEDIAAEWGLHEGKEITPQELEKLDSAAKKKNAFEQAYLLLSYRARSEKEMRLRLVRKGYADDLINAVIALLKEKKLLDDQSLARDLAESRMKGRSSMGERKILDDLAQKGIDRKTIESAMKNIKEDPDSSFLSEEERAWEALLKRARQIHRVDEHTRQRRLYEYLLRRGFAHDTIERTLNRYRREAKSGIDHSEF